VDDFFFDAVGDASVLLGILVDSAVAKIDFATIRWQSRLARRMCHHEALQH
jgi:hypothetical protein